ncbi:MAG: YihY/virulence factor BrkB family protein [Pseudomonadota bacterium]
MDLTEDDISRGREAETPSEIPARGLKDVLWRVWISLTQDHVMLIAGGVTFYLLLALFPALVAFMSIYGIFFDPATAVDQAQSLRGLIPPAAVDLIAEQLARLTSKKSDTLTLGLIVSLVVAFWSANGGVKAMIEGLNFAYNEREKRSFLRLNVIAFAFTLGAMALILVLFVALAIMPAMLALLSLSPLEIFVMKLLRWPLLVVVLGVALTMLYRYGPSRRSPLWRWVTWGSAFATISWLVMSIVFTVYLDRVANFDATYGALAAPIGFLLWVWLSIIVIILGAEINGELEHQTVMDTTIGPDRPMGKRGAVMADTLGAPSD